MDYSNVSEPFSFLPGSSKSIFFVKLSEDALQSLEEYKRMEVSNGCKPTIQFKGDKGIMTMPCENGKVFYDFSMLPMDANRSQGSFQCMEKSEEGELTSLGNIETKMLFHANDASIRHTKSKIEAVDKKQKTYGAKVIKTATASQSISSQGSQKVSKAFIKDFQERPSAPQRRKPVPLLKKFLNRNLQRQINKSLSSVNSDVTSPNQNNHQATVLSQTPLPKLSKETNKKHVLEDSCDNYLDLRPKKQRISHSNQKERVSVDNVLSSKTHITNGTKSEGASMKSVDKLLPVPGNTSKPDNHMWNCIEQLLNICHQEQKTKETEKKHALDNKIYSDPCKKKNMISQGLPNNLIELGKKNLVPVIKPKEQAIDLKNLFKTQSSLNTSKSSVASTRKEDIQSQDPDCLRLKHEDIHTNGMSLKTSGTSAVTSGTSTAASKCVFSTLDRLPLKNTITDTELMNLQSTQPCVNGGCEVTSTTEKEIITAKVTLPETVEVSSGSTGISMQNHPIIDDIETIEEREECREFYTLYLEEYNKLQIDQRISRQYLESLEHTMTIHLANSSIFSELKEKYLKTLSHYEKRLARRQTLSIHLGLLYNLIFKFDSKLY